MWSSRLSLLRAPLWTRSASAVSNGPVGFVGLGNMGLPMASNLLKSGRQLYVFDVNPTAVETLRAQGAKACATPAEVGAAARSVVSMLPSNQIIRQVYLGSDGLLSDINEGSLLIDCSTSEPVVAKELADAAAKSGSRLFDAPVSGGTMGAEQASLTFMVGGPEDSFPAAEELLSLMGKTVVHCGDVGMGQAAKLCNNLLLAVTMTGLCEAHALGGRLGLDQKKLADIINTSSGRCWSADTYNPCPGVLPNVPASRGYTGGFAVDLMIKDLSLASSAAASVQPKLPLPFSGLALQLYTLMSQQGGGRKDFSSIYELIEQVHKKPSGSQ